MFVQVIVLFAMMLALTNAFQSRFAASSSMTKLSMNDDRSIALPFDRRPVNLDGSLPGDVGFDPAGFSNNPPRTWLIGGDENSLKWYREAEIVHGRVAQLAVVGNLVPGWIGHLPGNPAMGVPEDAFAELNPFKALSTIPDTGLWHIVTFIYAIEICRAANVIRGDKEPGDLGLGQTGWNPFGFNYTPEEYREKQVQEIKHGRLAMFGALGMLLQASASGMGVTQQLAGALSFPDYRFPGGGSGFGTFGNGDFFPPNI